MRADSGPAAALAAVLAVPLRDLCGVRRRALVRVVDLGHDRDHGERGDDEHEHALRTKEHPHAGVPDLIHDPRQPQFLACRVPPRRPAHNHPSGQPGHLVPVALPREPPVRLLGAEDDQVRHHVEPDEEERRCPPSACTATTSLVDEADEEGERPGG